ncbi:30S ribosomal protein S12 methylthiotransferase RimO [Clostridium folliculivorans]|uniref:Ribosomal protein uS12 methylthiotransferase RimO n=1 Tax=Clostridium folliculivorans TaxID=2886038 RepID=A0A9W5Y1C2_9CLOT|nr:30S ribosomal protein S12 methylthiotransferase RimO [Clostridium folliculivorans]GKU24739.1 ribosomal protein S12 methylthiotransferase RimO [Clostridium folliculivorans]GKU30837.1 ribosomal protein S12 methylthiotransferase RimO [Clostridium folliculivorans]
MTKYKVGLISLGCDKNRVDSEIMLGKLKSGYELTNDPKSADIIIVNTCGFIEKAKQESIDTILEMAEYKNKYNCRLLIATGCLTQRYGSELTELMPEIDIMLGVNDYNKIDEFIRSFIEEEEGRITKLEYSNTNINEGERVITTDKATAYIRISEGCDNFCTYCIIPKIRGKYRSRALESVLEEAKKLASAGVKELILIGQDTTRYGIDLYEENRLHVLLNELGKIEGIEWIRLLYCYPEEIYDELIDEIASNPKVCKYIDLPIQHISDNILKAMGRKTTKEDIINKIELLREKVKGITLRTSLIVGFPGETDEDFSELKNFLKDYKLEKVGVFKYSKEEGTPAFLMPNHVEEEVKEKREELLMLTQMDVSETTNKAKIGNIYDVLIEEYDGENYIGRSYEMAPEIDGTIIVNHTKDKLTIGDIIKVKITDSAEYDLLGVVCNESC